jgi:clan AA aspartic protease
MTPRAEVEVGGSKGKVAIEAIVDTGFDGHLCIPVEVAVHLGLELNGAVIYELADGSRKRELTFKANAHFLGSTRRVTVSLTDADALIGTQLLADCRLVIDFPKNTVSVTRSKTVPKRSPD